MTTPPDVPIRVYVGTYTRPVPHVKSPNQGKGIYRYTLDPATGKLTDEAVWEGIDNPSFVALHPDKHHLYAVTERSEWPEGLVHAFALDGERGDLTHFNLQGSAGGSPAYVATDRTGRALLVANYTPSKQQAALYPIREDGSLAPVSSTVQHEGTGPNAGRQEAPHAHCIMPDPTNRYAMVVDLGIDQIKVYRMDLDAGTLTPNDPPGVVLPPGSGPRHLTFHPNGRFAYAICELDSTLHTLAYDGTTGTLTLVQSLSTLPDDHDGSESYAAEVALPKSGRYVYASNRGHDSLAIYAVDDPTGRLSLIEHQPSGGRWPRHFAIDPTDTFLLAAHQDSDTIVTFRIDPATGTLEPTGHVTTCPSPVCIVMAEYRVLSEK